ncbi:hypothetical protein I3760_04G151900 [Carya illinoinensis]|nr:hypothetical protein I3760_04G151900 [Carya illinoinensis]
MEMLRVHLLVMASFAPVLLIMGMPSIHAQSLAPAPGIALAIDQGIAYVLMAVALLLTYMIH